MIDAVRRHQFSIWAGRTVDQAVKILTRTHAGRRVRDSTFAAGTVHGRVEVRLPQYAEAIREFGGVHAQSASRNGAGR